MNVDFSHILCVASSDINEEAIQKMNAKNHQIDIFGIGTNLVTCQACPALGMVYKVVEYKNVPRIKLSEEPGKTLIPGAKDVLRAYDAQGLPVFDLLCIGSERERYLAGDGLEGPFYDYVKLGEPHSFPQVTRFASLTTKLFEKGEIVIE